MYTRELSTLCFSWLAQCLPELVRLFSALLVHESITTNYHVISEWHIYAHMPCNIKMATVCIVHVIYTLSEKLTVF